jgi:hypothetical protein
MAMVGMLIAGCNGQIGESEIGSAGNNGNNDTGGTGGSGSRDAAGAAPGDSGAGGGPGTTGIGGRGGTLGGTAGSGGPGIADGGAAKTSDASPPPPSTTGTIVPLYSDPSDGSWIAIAAAKQQHPSVPVVAIVNPNSGPGASRDASYSTGIGKLQLAGITVIGYVATGYTARGIPAVEADIDRWKSFYPTIQGIFFDEQSNQTGDEAFYRTVSQYAKANALSFTVGNPGADTGPTYVGVVDVGLIYESLGLPNTNTLSGWHTSYPRSNFGIIPYGAALDHAYVTSAKAYVGYVYVTSDTLPNPWDSLPPYFADLLADLE